MKDAEVKAAFEQKLKEGAWRTAAEAKEWLHSEMGIERSVSNIYYWMGKLAGALKMPRPVHIKKDPAEAELFKAHLVDRLRELNIEAGKRVKVWVQDEARYGLHSARRRCRGLKNRPGKSSNGDMYTVRWRWSMAAGSSVICPL
jgi:hypothetical protein